MVAKAVISTKGSRQWQGIPAIERAANGRLWCAFYSGGPKEPHPENHILITSSSDDGKTWEEPKTIIEGPGDTRVFDPGLWHDPSGRLWMFYNQANLDEMDHSVWAISTRESESCEPKWTEPTKLHFGVPYAFRLNKPTVLGSGVWLLPVTWARAAPKQWFAGASQLQGVAHSADEGRSWTLHGAVEAPAWALENMILERRNGTLLMLIRTGDGVIWQSHSPDGGRAWTTASPTKIVNPGTRFFIRRLASGRTILLNTPNPKERTGLYGYLSEPDDDLEFGTGVELDDRKQVSYPDAIEGPGGTIYAVYDRDRYGVGEILLCTFTEEDILRRATGPS